MNVPRKSETPEKSPLVVGSEHRRCTALYRCVGHVSVVVAITGREERSEISIQTISSRRSLVKRILPRESYAVHIAVRKSLSVVRHTAVLCLGDVVLGCREHIVNLIERMVELCGNIPGECRICAV